MVPLISDQPMHLLVLKPSWPGYVPYLVNLALFVSIKVGFVSVKPKAKVGQANLLRVPLPLFNSPPELLLHSRRLQHQLRRRCSLSSGGVSHQTQKPLKTTPLCHIFRKCILCVFESTKLSYLCLGVLEPNSALASNWSRSLEVRRC